MPFSWVPFYREVAQEVLKYEDKQDELIALLREMKPAGLPTIPLEENQPDGTMTPLYELDPFSFMSNLARVELPQFIKICTWLKKKWGLESAIPNDYEGRLGASARGGGSWFFTSLGDREGRGPEDIARLWSLARQAFDGKPEDLNPELFALCMSHKNLGIRKLSNGLSWFSPKGFLPLGDPMLFYLKANGVEFDARGIERRDLEAYRDLMVKAHDLNFDNLALVKAAQEWKKSNPLPPAPTQSFPLNQILYGPPGTGKTFNSINRAVEIIDGLAPSDREECKTRFDELREAGQIEFVTFHQSFSYEEFIEGLRPVLDGEGDGTARYEIRDGVLKDLALRALGTSLKKAAPNIPTFDDLWDSLLEEIESKGVELVGLSGTSKYRLSVTTQGNIDGENIDSNVILTCSRKKAAAVWRASSGESKVNSSFAKDIVGNSHTGLIAAVVNKLKTMSPHIVGKETSESNYGEMAQSYFDGSADYQADFQNAPRHVLIVDEINRGNISKILGELITLLEDDKRLGASNELRVKLPVSCESFCLSPNLYILGTMNTADKSLALLDIALRRRFSFVEMPPRVGLFPDFARTVLETLNLRLEAALDREHRLGHAYFIGCKDEEGFNRVFRDKIIPLLQEFFYNDWETLRAVLGESGQNSEKLGFIRSLKTLKGMKARTKWRWWFDADSAEELNCFAVLKANYDKLNDDTSDGDE